MQNDQTVNVSRTWHDVPRVTADETLYFAHRDRLKRAKGELVDAAMAPAFFKPEWTERAQADVEAAREGMKLAGA